MKLDIKSKRDNVLLSRTEVNFSVEHIKGSTPSRLEARRQLASKLGVNENLIVIKSLKTSFGSNTSKGVAHIYKTEKALKSIEPAHLLKRLEPKKAKEKPVEEAKPKEKSEEKSEEKEEEKPAEEEKTEEKPEGE